MTSGSASSIRIMKRPLAVRCAEQNSTVAPVRWASLGSAQTMLLPMRLSREVASCRPADCLSDVLSMMVRRGIVHVPAIDVGFGYR